LGCHQKKGEMFFACVNLWCWTYRLNVNCWNLPETKRFFQVLFLHPDLYKHQTLLSYFYGPQGIIFSLDFLSRSQLVA
jgi:hypothetical protein